MAAPKVANILTGPAVIWYRAPVANFSPADMDVIAARRLSVPVGEVWLHRGADRLQVHAGRKGSHSQRGTGRAAALFDLRGRNFLVCAERGQPGYVQPGIGSGIFDNVWRSGRRSWRVRAIHRGWNCGT